MDKIVAEIRERKFAWSIDCAETMEGDEGDEGMRQGYGIENIVLRPKTIILWWPLVWHSGV